MSGLRPLQGPELAMWKLENLAGCGRLARAFKLRGGPGSDALRAGFRRLVQDFPVVAGTISDQRPVWQPTTRSTTPDPEVEILPWKPSASAAQFLEHALNGAAWAGEEIALRVAFSAPNDPPGARDPVLVSVTGHHALLDGQGMNSVCQRLLEDANATVPWTRSVDRRAGPHPPPPVDELIRRQLGDDHVEAVIEHGLEREAELLGADEWKSWPTDDAAPVRRTSMVVARDFGPDTTSSLQRYAASHGLTLHSLLGAGLLHAVASELADDENDVPLILVTTTDLRPSVDAAPPPSELGNFSSGLRTFHKVSTVLPLTVLAREIRDAVRWFRDELAPFLGVFLQPDLVEFMCETNYSPGPVTLSHIGTAPTLRCDWPIEQFAGGVPAHGFGATLYNHTALVAGRLRWTSVFPAGLQSREWLENVAGRAANRVAQST